MITKYIILFLYFGVLFLLGFLATKKISGAKDYYVGGKKLGYWVVAFSSRASGESAWLLLGLTGMGAMIGLQAVWIVLGEVIGVAFAWLFMA
ncbi:MAG: sodium/proline symporter, partial [Flavobacteriales bacterium]